jgi:hypothetical protein
MPYKKRAKRAMNCRTMHSVIQNLSPILFIDRKHDTVFMLWNIYMIMIM